jgi:preprotein translocase subunit SecY
MAKSLPVNNSGLGELFSRIKFVFFAVLIYRIGAHIPVPGINPDALHRMFQQNEGTILGLFNMFSGGALERMSVLALGIMPYISASIIIQLLTSVVPQLEHLKNEGMHGKRKISQYTRYLTILLAFIQGSGMTFGIANQGVALEASMSFYSVAIITLMTGSVFLMWLGEQITERGIGNGISILIFSGIVAGFPGAISRSFEAARQGDTNILMLLLVAALAIAVIALVIFVERGQRRIPVNYAKRQQGRKVFAGQVSHLPLKLNMAGVIPAIFASSILLFPASIAQWFGQSDKLEWLQSVAMALSPGQPLNVILFILGITFFCFFYTGLVFNPRDVANNLKKSGAFIPGIRPGEQSSKYIDEVLTRLTVFGACYMSAVCLLPQFLVVSANVPFYLGGTSLLIVVVVVMDTMSQIQSHLMSHQYDSLLKKSPMRRSEV